jgi:hypothetical protein
MKPTTYTKLLKHHSEYSSYKIEEVDKIFRKAYRNGQWVDDDCYRLKLRPRPASSRLMMEISTYLEEMTGHEILFDFDDACPII